MTKSSEPTESRKGLRLERRVGRLYFWTGFFSRTGVNLKDLFQAESLLLTDLDLLAYHITELLTIEKTIGECKGGRGKHAAKPLDRTFWLAGLREFTEADSAVLVTGQSVSSPIRRAADKLGVRLIATDELQRMEQSAGVNELDFGSYARELDDLWDDLRKDAKRETIFDRAWRFLQTDVWHQDPWIALKRVVSMLKVVSKHWDDSRTVERPRLVRSLLAEGSVVFSLASLQIAGQLRWLPDDEANLLLDERLSEGLAPKAHLERLSEGVDRFVTELLTELDAPHSAKVKAIGAFAPRPPDWAEAFGELALRLSEEPIHSRFLPRLMDLALYETVVRSRPIDRAAIHALRLRDPSATLRIGRLVGKFLEKQAEVPPEVFDGIALGNDRESASGQPEQLSMSDEKRE